MTRRKRSRRPSRRGPSQGLDEVERLLDGDTTYVPSGAATSPTPTSSATAPTAPGCRSSGEVGHHARRKIGDGLEIWGGNSNDLVKGNDEDNVVHGGDGKDEVRGKKGNDTLTGDDGDDLLKGGKGGDALLGGVGSDALKGGQGEDVFAFAELKAGKDEILDFTRGKDLIDLSAMTRRLRQGG